MKELNLHIMNNGQLSTFVSGVIHLSENSEISGILELGLFKKVSDTYERYWDTCLKVQKNKYTEQLQLADKKRTDDYKATYYAVKSHLFLSDIEDKTAAKELLHLLKHSPRKVERMRQSKRSGVIQLLLALSKNERVSRFVNALAMERWIAALRKSNESYEAASQAFFKELYENKKSGSSTLFRPELIEAMNAYFHYLHAYCTIHTDEPILHLKAMIETEYKEVRTVCRRNATRRKNKRANTENESNPASATDFQPSET
ncbi:MAG: DUF6261 family protein [Bacteroidales bacterium]